MSLKASAVMKVAALAAGAASLYALLSALTQGMLGSAGPEEVWWDRVYAWWVGFLSAGLLLMLAVYLWRKAQHLTRSAPAAQHGRAVWRVVLFPAGHVLLTGCLYFADFASYLRDQGSGGAGSNPSMAYFLVAAVLVSGAAVVFWWAHKLKQPDRLAR
jgi:hypothetical protein